MRSTFVSRVVPVMVTIVLAAAACSSGSKAAASPIRGMSVAEYRYGVAPTRNRGVTYQPDVVIPGGGASSVRSVSADGLTWTLDRGAAGVDQLRPGKILFVTNHGAGRVLGVRRIGPDVAVTIGPVAITDVIQKADIRYSGPIDARRIIFRAGPAVPGNEVPIFDASTEPSTPNRSGPVTTTTSPLGSTSPATTPTTPAPPGSTAPAVTTTTVATTRPRQAQAKPASNPASASGGPAHAGLVAPVAALGRGLDRLLGAPAPAVAPFAATPTVPGGQLPLPTPSPPEVPITGLSMTPLAASYGFGVQVGYDKAGVKVFGQAVMYVSHPSLGFDLRISGGRLQRAKIVLHGAAGVRLQFQAGSVNGISGNVHEIAQLPVDISIPIAGPAVPLAITLHQSLLINSTFSAKNSTLRFDGDYGFDGSLGFGYDNGHIGADAPSGFHVRKSLLQSIDGKSVGVNGIVIAYQLKVIVGIGGWGFAVGPYFSLTASAAIANGSDLGIVKCRGATFDLSLGYGIGYSIPVTVTNAINFFLRALNLGRIRPSGGTPPILQSLVHKQGYAPDLALCAGAV